MPLAHFLLKISLTQQIQKLCPRLDVVNAGDFPVIINPKGLDLKHQWYLFNNIQEFIAPYAQDIVAPPPTETLGAAAASDGETDDPPPTKHKKRA